MSDHSVAGKKPLSTDIRDDGIVDRATGPSSYNLLRIELPGFAEDIAMDRNDGNVFRVMG